jgi:hypothetical protein
MEKTMLVAYICERLCSFYGPDKEILECGSFKFLKENLSPGELREAVEGAPRRADCSEDSAIMEMVCSGCDFLVDGCDFRESRPHSGSGPSRKGETMSRKKGTASPPCGGYAVVEGLLKGRKSP